MEFLKINKKLLPVKIHYFLLNGAHSGVITFIPVYALQLGITSSAIGTILAILAFLTVISRTGFGSIVDHFQKLKHVLLFLIFIDIAADLGLNFIPLQTSTNSTEGDKLTCINGSSYILQRSCPEYDYINCSATCSLCQSRSAVCSPFSNKTGLGDHLVWLNSSFSEVHCQVDNSECDESCYSNSTQCSNTKEDNPPLQLWLLSVLAGVVYMANGAIVSLSDAACYNALEDQMHLFGKQRLWGTLGWGSFAFLTGYLNQVFAGHSGLYSYAAGFYLLVILFVVDLPVVTKLHLEEVPPSKNICKDVGKLFVQPRIVLFIVGTFGIGIFTGIARTYLYWYLRTTLAVSQLVLGCTSFIQCFLGELPFFFFSGLIIRKFGHNNTFTMSFVAYGFKFLSYSFLYNPWLALPIELLQGPCFGSFYAAMTSYSKKIAPEGTEATVQGVVSGTFEGLGVATGNLLGGFCLGIFGGRTTFYWAGLISLTAGFVHWLVHFIISQLFPGDRKLVGKQASIESGPRL